MKKISINWISEEITVLKITARRRRSDRTTEMQSIYFKELQVDQELNWIIRKGHFWCIWWYFWWNIISFWQFWSSDFLMICSPEFLMKWFIRNSNENPTCLKSQLYPATNDRSMTLLVIMITNATWTMDSMNMSNCYFMQDLLHE